MDVDRDEARKTARADAAFESALLRVEATASEFEQQLAESRARMEADEANFDRWQASMTTARNEGHFFKSLYKPTKQPGEQGLTPSTRVTKALRPQPNMLRSSFLTSLICFVLVALVSWLVKSE